MLAREQLPGSAMRLRPLQPPLERPLALGWLVLPIQHRESQRHPSLPAPR